MGQTLIWAAVYYSFPALLLTWESDLGWDKATLSGALTAALLTSAAASPLVGRLIDRGFGSWVMVGFTVIGAALLAGLSVVSTVWQFYAVWIALGLCMAGVLYEPCFAILTIAMATSARRAITYISLVAGFAGTVSFPSVHILVAHFGWRGCVLVLSVAAVITTVPLFWYGLHALGPTGSSDASATARTDRPAITHIVMQPAFWFLALAFAAIALNHGMLLTHLLPLLGERGIETALAVTAASCIGPMQVVGRLLMMGAERWLSTVGLTVASFAALLLSGISLLNAGSGALLVFTFVACQGAGVGVLSIMRPMITAEILGRTHFGTVAGLLAIGYLLAFAAAPSVAALLWRIAGYDLVILTAAVTAASGLLSTLLAAATKKPAKT